MRARRTIEDERRRERGGGEVGGKEKGEEDAPGE